MDPATIAMDFLSALAAATPTLFQLFTKAGSRDAFLVALDGVLATARAQDDADLAAKHRAGNP